MTYYRRELLIIIIVIRMGSLLSVTVALLMFCVWRGSVFHPKKLVYCEAFVSPWEKNMIDLSLKTWGLQVFAISWAILSKCQEMPDQILTKV